MRILCSFCLVLAFCLAGCSRKVANTTPPSTNAPVVNQGGESGGYLGALANGQRLAVKTVDVASLNQAIQMFNVDEGRFPKDLNELVEKQLIREIPKAPYGMQIEYDPATGTVSVVPQ